MNINQLAQNFAERIRHDLGCNLAEVVRRNAEETDPSVCHSHDFIDANQTMLNAMESLGIEFNPASWDQAKLIDESWGIAKRSGFTFRAPDSEREDFATDTRKREDRKELVDLLDEIQSQAKELHDLKGLILEAFDDDDDNAIETYKADAEFNLKELAKLLKDLP